MASLGETFGVLIVKLRRRMETGDITYQAHHRCQRQTLLCDLELNPLTFRLNTDINDAIFAL